MTCYNWFRMTHLCECGCGKATKIAARNRYHLGQVKGQPIRFINGHATRGRLGIHVRHGMSNSPEWNAWHNAKDRCRRRNHVQFSEYGGRGIEFRFKTFEEFYAALGPRPSNGHSLDRINNDGHYEAGNVRWATRSQQQVNRRHRLTPEQRQQIIRRRKAGEVGYTLAREFGVTRSYVYQLAIHGR